MKIKKIEISGFGKFNNYEINLNNDIQIIYGKNEAGKSTLMEFIKIMFYSRRKGEQTSSEDKALRNKFTPWNNSSMKGAIEFQIDNFNYRLQKEINKNSVSKDTTLLQNQSLGEEVKLGKREEVGEHILGLDLSSFERSVYIPDLGNYGFENTKSAKDSILDKIFNLSTTGESELSATEILERVNKAIKDLNSKRGKGGKIQNLESEIKDSQCNIEKLKNFEDEQSKLVEEIINVEKLINEKNVLQSVIKIHELEKIIDMIQNKNSLIRELNDLNIEYSNLEDIIENLSSISDEIEIYKDRTNEIEKLITSSDNNLILISDAELKSLVCDINRRNDLQSQIDRTELYSDINNPPSIILKNETSQDVNFVITKYENSTLELQKLLDYKKNIESYEESLNTQKTLLNHELDKEIINYSHKKKIYLTVLFIDITIIISTFISYFGFKSIFLYLCIVSIITTIGLFLPLSKYIKVNNNIESLKTEIYSYIKMSKSSELDKINKEILHLENDISKIKNEFSELSKKKLDYLNQELISIKNIIDKKLKDKNCLSISEYYENHAQSQSLSKSISINTQNSDKIKKLQSNFIIEIKKYKDVEDYSSALDFLSELIYKKQEIDNSQNEISSVLNVLGIEKSDLNDLKSKLDDLKSKTKLSNVNLQQYENNSEKLKKRIQELENLSLENKYIELKSKISNSEISLEELENDLEHRNQKLSEMKSYLQSLEIASDLMNETLNEIRMEFNPKLNDKSSEIFQQLTSGKYNNICITKDYEIMVKNDMMYKDCNNLSSGTIDQAYLSLRIAISKLISQKIQLPLILDDVLVRYDYNRMKSALNFLKENSKNNQTIMFTCHEHIASYAKQNGIKVINL